MRVMAAAPADQKISPALRFVEVFSSPETFKESGPVLGSVIYGHLTQQDYFGCARAVCEARVPPLLEETSSAPTPHAQAALDMVSRPLAIIYSDPNVKQQLRSVTDTYSTLSSQTHVSFMGWIFFSPSVFSDSDQIFYSTV